MKKVIVFLFLGFLIACGPSKIRRVEASKEATTSLENIVEANKSRANNVNNAVKSPIQETSVKEHLEYLASDELMGRKTGSDGLEKAADYIANYFNEYAIKPYFDSMHDDFEANGIPTYNIVGVVEGSDPNLKDEYVLLGAHYDHIGIIEEVMGDSIANGANDDASGTVAVMELAKYFAEVKTNRRSIIFALFSGEEMGLLGSKHLAQRLKQNQVNLYTMLEIEMIGVPMVDKDYSAYLTGYELSNMASVFNSYSNGEVLGFLPQAKEYQLFYRSDNASFYEALKIPAQTLSTFDFTNFDYYHQVGDEIEQMNIPHITTLINTLIPGIEGMTNSDAHIITLNEE
ncbi:M28 family peptidase [Flavimarina sp. Hel_I_48]|uniref:M28 family peptidase n=1 Tax=Flavimarina sp. Hel_I_48 TaxID=1392488 RepID=UPI0004DF38F2|nr:M28 family peptidase [Flavimarina sp. Hel_I_48]